MTKALFTALFFCFTTAHAAEELRVAVSTTAMQNVFKKTDKAFEQKTGIKITYIGDYKTGDSVEHLMSLVNGKADASTSGNKVSEVIKLAIERGHKHPDFDKVTERLIGRDLMAIYGNKNNGVTKLDLEQVEKIFTGKIKNWKEIGGKDLPVKIIIQAEKPATVETFKRIGMKGGEFPADIIKEKVHDDAAKKAGALPGGIAFGPTGIETGDSIKIETPPLGRAIFLFTVGKPNDKMFKFLEFLDKEGAKYGVGK